MKRYLVIIHDEADRAICWIGKNGNQIVSRANSSFEIDEEELEILKENLPVSLEVLEELVSE